MAKKKTRRKKAQKKLNRTVVIALAITGLAVVAIGALSVQRVRDWVFPKDPVAAAEQALQFAKAGDHKQADKYFRTSVGFSKDHPRGAEFCYDFANYELERVNTEKDLSPAVRRQLLREAMGLLDMAMIRDGRFVKAQERICSLRWRYYRANNGGVKASDYIAAADKLLEIDEENHRVLFRRALAKADQIKTGTTEKTKDDALADFDAAIELKSDAVEYWLGKINFLAGLELTEKKEIDAVFEASLAALPGSSQIRIRYADYLLAGGLRDEALEQIHVAIKSEANSTLGLQKLATIQIIDKRYAEAEETLLKALAIDPSNFLIYNGLIEVYRRTNDFPKVIAIARKGIEALDKDTASQPDSAPNQLAQRNREFGLFQLSYNLADFLLIQLSRKDVDDVEKTYEEIEACIERVGAVKEYGAPAYLESLKGRLAYSQGNFDTAQVHIEEAYKAFGDNFHPRTAETLINIYIKQNVPGKIDTVLDRFLTSNAYSRSVWPKLLKVQLLMNYRNYAEAQRWVTAVLEMDPDNREAKTRQAAIAVLTGEASSVPADLQLDGMMTQQIINNAASMWGDERRDEAIRLLEGLRSHDPGNMNVVSPLFSMYQDTKQLDTASKILKEASAANPEAAAQLKFMEQLLGENDPKKRVAMQIKWTETMADPVQRLLRQAYIYRTAGMREAHVQSLQAAHKADPNSIAAASQLCQAAVNERDWELAETLVAKIRKISKDDVRPNMLAAGVAKARGRIDEGIGYIREILAKHPNHKAARNELGNFLLAKRQYAEAEAEYSAVISSDPGFVGAAIGMMYVTRAQGKTDEYENWLQSAYRLAPRNPAVAEFYNVYLEQQSADPQVVIARRENRFRSNPDDMQNCISLGRLYERTRQLVKAEKMYKHVYGKMGNSLVAANILQQFLANAGRLSEADKVIRDAMTTSSDKVGAHIMYSHFLASRQPAQARSVLAQAISLDPQDYRGHIEMARFLIGTTPSDTKGAVDAAKRALMVAKDNKLLEKELIIYQIAAKDYQEAGRRLDQILAVNAADVQALRLKSQLVLTRDENFDEAIELLSRAVTSAPNDVVSLTLRAKMYQARGEFSAAKADLQVAQQLSHSADTGIKLADVYIRMREWSAAQAVLEDVLSRQNGYAPAIDRLIESYAQTANWPALEAILAEARKLFPKAPQYLVYESRMWRKRNMPERELASLKQALEEASGSPLAAATLRMYLGTLLRLEQYDQVLEVTARYVGATPVNLRAMAVRGQVMVKKNRKPEADEIFQKLATEARGSELDVVAGYMVWSYGAPEAISKLQAWRTREDDWMLKLSIAEIHYLVGQYGQSVKFLREALAEDRSDAAKVLIYLRLGRAYQSTGNHVEAEKAYVATLKYDPDNVDALNNLAYMYVDSLGDADKAFEYARKAARLAPSNSSILDTYGWVLAKMQRYASAERYLRLALVQSSPSAASRYHLGWVYEQQGQVNRAMNEYRLGQAMIDEDQRATNPIYKKCAEAITRIQSGAGTGSGS